MASSSAPQSGQPSPEEPVRRFGRLWREGRPPGLRQYLSQAGELSHADAAAIVRIDQCERWRAGERVPAEAYLRDHPFATPDVEAAIDLVYQEFLLREELGEAPGCDEYRRRFPHLAEQLVQQIELHLALESGGTEPTPEPPPWDDFAHRGTGVRRYTLLEKLGEGGMGEVWVADQQEPVRRRVAVKIIKAGMESARVVARFKQERQALAMMDHPNIAKVFDAGTTETGRPYFVMELVKGIPITRYCDGEHLTPRERLELFIPVLSAVQHAHLKGVIHRDLKPTNVLVALYDGRPVPKVIDFGVAKATGARLTERTIYTEVGSIMGTLEYMAPEQANLDNLDVDTRADVYSLGATLYELLTGGPPFSSRELRGAAFTDMMRVIHEVDPPKPSTKVSSSADLPSIAAARSLVPGRLVRLLSGELDCIVLKCLEKDRSRRYETANSLAADILRFLADEPVEAQLPSLRYRLAKVVRRNKLAVLSAALLLMALVGGVIGTTWGLVRAEKSRAVASANARESERAKDALTNALSDVQANLTRAESAEREARLREAEALVGQARGTRYSRREGQRFVTLAALKKAAEIGRAAGRPPAWFDRLRNEAIAALALSDLHIIRQWRGWPEGTAYLTVSGDFRVYARSDKGGAVSVRRMADDTEIAKLPGGPATAHLTLSQQGTHLGQVFRNDHAVFFARLWRVAAEGANELLEVKNVYSMTFMDRPEGRLAVFLHGDGAISVYWAATGKLRARYAAVELTNRCAIAAHPGEPLVAIGSYDHRTVLIRNVLTGAVVRREIPPWPGGSTCAWHPGGRYLCICRSDSDPAEVRVYHFHPPTGALKYWRSIPCGRGEPRLGFNGTGDRFADAGWHPTTSLWDFWTGQQLFETKSTIISRSPTLKPDGDELALAAVPERPDHVGVWSIGDAREYRAVVPSTRSEKVGAGAFEVHPGGRLVAQGFIDGVRIFDLTMGVELAHLSRGDAKAEGHLVGVSFDAAGCLYTNDFPGFFRWPVVRDPKNGDKWSVGPPTRLPFNPGNQRPGVSGDGSVIAQAMYTGYGMGPYAGGWILHPDSPAPRRVGAGLPYAAASVSPDGRWTAFAEHLGPAKVFEAATGKLVWQSPRRAAWCRFSGDGRWLLTGRDPGVGYAVGTWEAGPELGPGALNDCTADNMLAVLDLGSGVYRLVEMASGRELARLEDPDQFAGCVRFTPDGTRLVAQASNGLRVWDLRRIRQQLTELGLDWDAAPFAPEKPDPSPISPAQIEVIGAELIARPS
jgi:serine/threonine protein kinase/WD40 repeat protein